MKKSLSIFVIIFLFIAVLRLAGLTYGYYSTRIVKNTNSNSLSVTSKYLKVEFEDGTSIMNFKGDYLFPGDSAEKLWTVKNSGTEDATYNVLIDNVNNEFDRIQDLRYILYINNEEVSSGAVNNHLKQYLYTNKKIGASESDSLRLVFEYAETEEVQNIDMNKTISFRVNVDSNIISSLEGINNLEFISNGSLLNSYRVYGQSFQSSTPSGSSVDVLEVGDLTKNLLNPKNNELGSLSISNGGINKIEYVTTSDYISLKAGTYTISYKSGVNLRYIVLYNEEKEIIGNFWSNRANPYTFSIDSDCLIRIDMEKDGNETITDLDNFFLDYEVQLEEENVATEYEPFNKYKISIKNNNITTNIYLDEPLRGIGNYSDYIDFTKQSVVRKVKKIVFDGSEQINVLNSSPYPYTYYVLGNLGLVVNDMALSSHFGLQTNFSYTVDGSNMFRVLNSTLNNQSRIVFRIVDESGTITDVSKIQTLFQDAYNAGKPYIFYYVSTEEEEKYIKLPTIDIINGTNQIEVNTALPPSKLYLEYYK